MCVESAVEYRDCDHEDIEIRRCHGTNWSFNDCKEGQGRRYGATVTEYGKCRRCVKHEWKAMRSSEKPVARGNEVRGKGMRVRKKQPNNAPKKAGAEAREKKTETCLDSVKKSTNDDDNGEEIDDSKQQQKQKLSIVKASKAQRQQLEVETEDVSCEESNDITTTWNLTSQGGNI